MEFSGRLICRRAIPHHTPAAARWAEQRLIWTFVGYLSESCSISAFERFHRCWGGVCRTCIAPAPCNFLHRLQPAVSAIFCIVFHRAFLYSISSPHARCSNPSPKPQFFSRCHNGSSRMCAQLFPHSHLIAPALIFSNAWSDIFFVVLFHGISCYLQSNTVQ